MAAIAVEEHAFVEYLELDFVDDVSEFQCVRCNRVLFQHYISNCGHAFCANCRRVVDDGSAKWKCPKCKEYIRKINVQDEELHRKLFGLRAHCPNNKYGCDYVDQLKLIQSHLMQCKFTKDKALPKLLVNNLKDMRLNLMNDEVMRLREKIFQLEMKDKENEDKLEIKLNDIYDRINEVRSHSKAEIDKIINQTDTVIKNADVNLAIEECKTEISKFKGKSESWFEILEFKEKKLKKKFAKIKLELENKFQADLNDLKLQNCEELSQSYRDLSDKYENALKEVADLQFNLTQQGIQIEELSSTQKNEMIKNEKSSDEFGSEINQVQSSIKLLDWKINGGLANINELKNEINENKIKINNLKLENEKVIGMIDEVLEEIDGNIKSVKIKHENIEKGVEKINSVVSEHQRKLINDFEKLNNIDLFIKNEIKNQSETETSIKELLSMQKRFETELNESNKKIKKCQSKTAVLTDLLDNKETRSDSDRKIDNLSQIIKINIEEFDKKCNVNEKQTEENRREIENNCQSLSELKQKIVNKKTIENLVNKNNNEIKLESDKSIKVAFESIIELENELLNCIKDLELNKNIAKNSRRPTFQNLSSSSEPTINLLENKYNAVPRKTYNMLLVGQTGVGKSTFINAFCNYLKFENLESAKNKETEVLIPCNFTLQNEDYEQINIRVGDDPNENLGAQGQSSTQQCKPYEFNVHNFKLRIFDSPGIGDTRGIDQDKLNLQGMMDFLSSYDELHAICILLKPNEARLTPSFSFCIKQLLCQLHQNAKKNIVFVFTNSRGTFYKPGDTVKPLQYILKQVKEFPPYPEIPFKSSNIFCLDNEAFRFLIASKNNIKFEEEDFKNFAHSWKKSVDESERLIRYIVNGVEGQGISPHLIRESVLINNSKQVIVELSQPLSEIAKTIQQNLQVLNERKKEIENNINDQDILKKILYLPQVTLDIKELKHPRTVCTGDKCREVYKIGHYSAFHYPIICHDPCQLEKEVKREVIGDEALLYCVAIDRESGNCKFCGCNYRKHLHIYYTSETKDVKIVDENIQKQLKTKEGVLNAAKEIVERLENEISKYENERDKLTTYTAKLAIYLKQNAMVVVNDSYDEYLKELIENERSLSQSGSNNETVIKGLKEMLDSYKKEKDILDKAMSTSSQQQQISLEDVEKIILELGNMQNTGQLFQKVYEANSKNKSIFGKIKKQFDKIVGWSN